MSRLRVIDLFAGCGGLSLGFEWAGGFEAIYAVEHDGDAVQTYETNFACDVDSRPIEGVHSFPAADVIIGGPPCQGFSTLNRDRVGAERRSLWREYVRALRNSGARTFVMENVPQLLRSPEYVEFRIEAEALGFKIAERVLNAADFGVPQRRKRAIVIGMKDAVPALPPATHAEVETLHGERPWMTFGQAVAGLPLVPDGRNWHTPRFPRDISLIRYSRVPHDGGDRFEMQRQLEAEGLGHLIPPCWRRKTVGTTDVFGRLWWDRPAVTLRTEFFKPEKGRYLHPSEDRAITLREGARCMGFPDDFVFPADQSMTAVGRQIGNAVPPLLGQRVAEAVLAALGDRGGLRAAA
jgi:DNA (cytosine-5)-methyltransferase 1